MRQSNNFYCLKAANFSFFANHLASYNTWRIAEERCLACIVFLCRKSSRSRFFVWLPALLICSVQHDTASVKSRCEVNRAISEMPLLAESQVPSSKATLNSGGRVIARKWWIQPSTMFLRSKIQCKGLSTAKVFSIHTTALCSVHKSHLYKSV